MGYKCENEVNVIVTALNPKKKIPAVFVMRVVN